MGGRRGVFNRELMVLYEAYREGRENPLKPLEVQYADFGDMAAELAGRGCAEPRAGVLEGEVGGDSGAGWSCRRIIRGQLYRRSELRRARRR